MTDHNEDVSNLGNTAQRAQDALASAAARAKMKAEGHLDQREFAHLAAISDLYEETAAKIAQRRSRSEQIRFFAAKMIKDHRTSSHQLRSALRMNETDTITDLPVDVDERRRSMIEHLEGAPDEKFDETYVDQQVKAHKEAIGLMRGYMEKGDNAQLGSFARASLPVVERHHEEITNIARGI